MMMNSNSSITLELLSCPKPSYTTERPIDCYSGVMFQHIHLVFPLRILKFKSNPDFFSLTSIQILVKFEHTMLQFVSPLSKVRLKSNLKFFVSSHQRSRTREGTNFILRIILQNNFELSLEALLSDSESDRISTACLQTFRIYR